MKSYLTVYIQSLTGNTEPRLGVISRRNWSSPCICHHSPWSTGIHGQHHAVVRCVRGYDVSSQSLCDCGHFLQSMVSHSTGRLLSICSSILTVYTRRATRALRRVNVNVTIHGGKYHGVLLIVLESGMLYILALVHIPFAICNAGAC